MIIHCKDCQNVIQFGFYSRKKEEIGYLWVQTKNAQHKSRTCDDDTLESESNTNKTNFLLEQNEKASKQSGKNILIPKQNDGCPDG